MTQENNENAEKFLKEKYLTANEGSQFGFNEVVSILSEYSDKIKNLNKAPVMLSLPSDEEVRLKCYMSRDKSLENTYVAGFFKGARYMRKEIESRNGTLGNGA